jgi:transmembrane sensor
MKNFPDHTATAEEQASLWAARLDGSDLTPADRAALDAWLAAAPAHRALLSAYCQFSADLEQQLPLLEGIKDQTAESSCEQTSARSRPWSFRPLWVGAMLTAAAAVVALVVWNGRLATPAAIEFATGGAQRQSVALADGSRVELNAHTQIAATLSAHERRVRLASGQAFFSVAKDSSRPFFVETPSGTVRVTGTQFDVRADDVARFQVTVLEGSVQVQPADSAALALKAGDQYALGAVRALDAKDLNAFLAWRNGEIVFDRAPLRDVLAAYGRHHDCVITVSPGAAQRRLTGRFNLDNLPQFLELLPENFDNLTVSRDSHGQVRVSLANER